MSSSTRKLFAALTVLAAVAAAPQAQAQVAPATGVAITASAPSPQTAGVPVTFTAAGQGSSGYQYRFWLWSNNVPTLVQDFSAAATWTMPVTTAPGQYIVQADVRTSTTTFAEPIAGRDAWVKLPFTVNAAFATAVAVTPSVASPQIAGAPVTFTAAGQGSSGYQYRFWLWSNGVPALVQDFGPSATWTMPATTAAGSYVVQADVRTNSTAFADPIAARDAFVKLAYDVRAPFATGVTLASSAPSPSLTGAAVTFTAAGQGSSGYQYRFWLWSNNIPTIVQDWSTSPTWLMPGTTAAGSYVVQADVRTSAIAFAEPIAQRDAWVKLPFTVNFGAPAPTIASLSVATGASGGGDPVTITGTNFVAGATVEFDIGFPATIVSTTATSISVTTPPHPAATVDVIVTNPDGQKATLPASFTYTLGLKPPKIAAITPATDFEKGGSQVTITGTGFTPQSVTFGGVAGTIVAVSTTSILVTTPPHVAGVVDVTVTNIDLVSSTLPASFTYVAAPVAAPAPVLTSIFPVSGANTGGTPVSLTGANFQTGVQVFFGGVAATFVSFNVGGIVVNTPPHAGGFVDVTVVNPDGQTVTLGQAYQYIAPGPNITALNIHGSPMAGGQIVLIAGSGFDGTSTVTFGGVRATGLSYDAVNKVLQVTTPPGPGGLEAFVNVTVTNPDGQSAGFTGFHYGPPPNPTDFFSDVNGTKTLNNGKAGQVIDIIGTDFSTQVGRGVQVLFSGPASGFGTLNAALSNPTTLSVGIPKLNPGTYTIIITNFDGQFKIAPGQLIILGP